MQYEDLGYNVIGFPFFMCQPTPAYHFSYYSVSDTSSNKQNKKMAKKTQEIEVMKKIIFHQENELILNSLKESLEFKYLQDVLGIIKDYLGNSTNKIDIYSKQQIIQEARIKYLGTKPKGIFEKLKSHFKDKNTTTTEKYLIEKYFSNDHSVKSINVLTHELDQVKLSGVNTEILDDLGSTE